MQHECVTLMEHTAAWSIARLAESRLATVDITPCRS